MEIGEASARFGEAAFDLGERTFGIGETTFASGEPRRRLGEAPPALGRWSRRIGEPSIATGRSSKRIGETPLGKGDSSLPAGEPSFKRPDDPRSPSLQAQMELLSASVQNERSTSPSRKAGPCERSRATTTHGLQRPIRRDVTARPRYRSPGHGDVVTSLPPSQALKGRHSALSGRVDAVTAGAVADPGTAAEARAGWARAPRASPGSRRADW